MALPSTETQESPESLLGLRSDEDLRAIVQEELEWDSPIKNAASIGVSIRYGVVTLSGQVSSSAEKIAAQDAAHRVRGVLDVANDIAVSDSGAASDSISRTDADIAQEIRSALEWETLIPEQKIRSTVTDGWVTLEGTVPCESHRDDAERAIRNLAGVRGVTNAIAVVPEIPAPDPEQVRSAIAVALGRQTNREVRRLSVTVEGETVILTGTVRSWPEKLAAGGAAVGTPGVGKVENRLSVDPRL